MATHCKIATENVAGVPTAQGGREWYAATVRHVLLRTSEPHLKKSGSADVLTPPP